MSVLISVSVFLTLGSMANYYYVGIVNYSHRKYYNIIVFPVLAKNIIIIHVYTCIYQHWTNPYYTLCTSFMICPRASYLYVVDCSLFFANVKFNIDTEYLISFRQRSTTYSNNSGTSTGGSTITVSDGVCAALHKEKRMYLITKE